MTIIHISINDWGRVKIGNRYVWIDYHPYCGPQFFWDSKMTKPYEVDGERDPVWKALDAWLKKREARK